MRRQLAAAVTAIGRLLAEESAGTARGSGSFSQGLCEAETLLRQACQSLDTTFREKAGQLHYLQSTLNEEMVQRARADRQVRESEERLRLALRSAGQGLYDLNVQTGDAVVSPEYAEMLGYDPETFLETNSLWIERLHPDDRETVAATYLDYISGRIPEYRVEFRQKTKNGDWIWILSIGRIVEYDEQGVPLRMLGTHTDITERKIAEEKMRESEQAFRNLFESSLDGVFRIAADSRIERANAAFAQIFGLSSPQEIIGRSIADFWKHPLERSMYLDTLRQHGAVQRYPFLAVGVSGKTIHVEVTANLIRNSSGEYVATEGILRDVTGQKQLAEQLLHAQKMEAVGRLAGGIAHDFNNILSAIVGFASLPLMSQNVSEAERATLEQILVLAERAGTLTRGLMAFSRRQVMSVRAVDLNQIMGISAKLLQRMIGEDINLVLQESPDPLPVQADTGQMEQVLMNLATNARDAMPAGGMLTIEARRIGLHEHEVEGLAAGDYALITVADTGTGIAPDLLDHVFEPFFTTKEEGKGTGLGLASVYGIMQQHGGSVRVESEPGAGTTFFLYIPISMSAAEQCGGAGSQPISGGSETILLVEDDATLRRITGKILAAHGYTVLEAVNGAEMLNTCAARKGRIDLILSDVVMPVMDGLEAWREVRLRYPDIRGVFMSGYISDEGKRAAIEQFGLPFIIKPFEPRHLLSMVRRELDRA